MLSKPVGKNDMTALREISDAAIAENLKERLKAGIIYVSVQYISMVLADYISYVSLKLIIGLEP